MNALSFFAEMEDYGSRTLQTLSDLRDELAQVLFLLSLFYFYFFTRDSPLDRRMLLNIFGKEVNRKKSQCQFLKNS